MFIIILTTSCSSIDQNAVATAVNQTLQSNKTTQTPPATHTVYPTQTNYPTYTPYPSQIPFNTEPPTYIIVTSTPLPSIGSSIDCDNFSFRILETEQSQYLKAFNPPSGIYLIIYSEITNSKEKTIMEIDPSIFEIESKINGKSVVYTIYPEYKFWSYSSWNLTLFKGGFQGLFEPFYPNAPSKVMLIYDIHPDSSNPELMIKGCSSRISIGKNIPSISKSVGGKNLPAPEPVSRELLVDYKETYWKDIVENPSSLEGNKVILRGRIRRILNENTFEIYISGTYLRYEIVMTSNLDRIYSDEAVTVYGTMKDGKLIGDYVEVTNIPR